MSTDWRSLSHGAGLTLEGDSLVVRFPNDRKQQVFVDEGTDARALRLWSVAAMPSKVTQAAEGDSRHLLAWRRNRASDLVGFKIDGKGRMVGEAWVPLAGLDPDEWRTYVLAVAQACDRVEYLLSGRDDG